MASARRKAASAAWLSPRSRACEPSTNNDCRSGLLETCCEYVELAIAKKQQTNTQKTAAWRIARSKTPLQTSKFNRKQYNSARTTISFCDCSRSGSWHDPCSHLDRKSCFGSRHRRSKTKLAGRHTPRERYLIGK